MTDKEIARELEEMIIEDGKRPPREQIQDLIDLGIIDEQGRVLIGGMMEPPKNVRKNGQADVSPRRKKPKAKNRPTA